MTNQPTNQSTNQLNFVETADGSKTIYNPQVGENYHSRHGALQESEHVFLNSGLRHYLADKTVSEVSILEVGFGTGLNFLLSADFCIKQQINLNYVGIEAHPLSREMISQTGYNEYTSAGLWQQFTDQYVASLSSPVQLNPYIQLQTAHNTLMDFRADVQFDVIYFDAFASLHQPEMWNEEAINHTIQYLKPNGIFVTYAITGNLKRQLKTLGLKIEKAPGAAGKREMLRGTKIA
ncbi:MAG: tRNA (5-methylaminomethyl-2-thiouridine)(34)-methyltransferase MnmD [Mucilaginibacter sp.]|uniref:tRNA (5-methylaminomethyl-2-thiouridine)(34)-methyltransferase MnmD n=1 Tax=Mucilaginibacter sp. TaxID=1882438 RepID=UPI0032636495